MSKSSKTFIAGVAVGIVSYHLYLNLNGKGNTGG